MKTMEDYRQGNYTREQLIELQRGLKHGYDVSKYDDPAYTAEHMFYINNALADSVDITRLLDPTLSFEQVRQIEFTLMCEEMKANGMEMSEEDIADAHASGFIIP